MEAHSPAKLRRFDLLAILAISLVTLIVGLGSLSLIGPDEPRYAEVAREMFVSGDYISTRLCGCLWFEKPALLYWLSAASYRVFGVGEFAARLPSALAALSIVIAMYWWLRKHTTRQLALYFAVVLSTSGLFIAYARVATPDMLLAAAMTLSLTAAYEASKESGTRSLHWVVIGLGLALAMLAKGLVGIVLTPTIVLFYAAIRREWSWVTWKGLFISALVFVLISSLWYVPVTARHGNEFLIEFFGRHHFRRYVSNVYGHPQPFYFFIVVAILGSAPWSLFLIPAASRLRELMRGGEKEALLLFAWLWLIVPVLFFSFSGSKLPGYILMVTPPLAFIIASEIDEFCRGERSRTLLTAGFGTAVLASLLGIAFLLFVIRELGNIGGWKIALSLLPLIAAAIATCMLLIGRRNLFPVGIGSTVCAIVAGTVFIVFGALNDQLSLKPLSLEVAAALRPGERICFFIKKEFAPVFYAQGRVICGSGEMDIFNALRENILESALEDLKQKGIDSTIVVTTENWRRGLETYPRFDTQLLATQESPAFRFSFARRDAETALAFRVSLKP